MPLNLAPPVFMNVTFEAVMPPVDGLRMMASQAGLVGSKLGLLAGLKHCQYTEGLDSGAIIPSILIRYQSIEPENPASSELSERGWNTRPPVEVVASSGLTVGLPVALTNHS